MKQRIEMEQLQELTEGQKERIREWWYGSPPRLSDVYAVLVKYDDVTKYEGPHVNIGHRNFLEDYHIGEALPLLSIGQMIEMLIPDSGMGSLRDVASDIEIWSPGEMCDRLWELLKESLN